MRTFKDRLRHTFMFEMLALALIMTFGSWITGHGIAVLGTFGLMMSLIAMAWNFVFNWLFDLWDRKYRGMMPRGPLIRAVHATLFEAFLLFVGLFLAAWWLTISYKEAFFLDIGFSAFFLVYAYAFNWGYDVVFPVSREEPEAVQA